MATPIPLPVFPNGPVEVGIAAGVDSFEDSSRYLPLASDTPGHYLSLVPVRAEWPDEVKGFAVWCAGWINSRKCHEVNSSNAGSETRPAVHSAAEISSWLEKAPSPGHCLTLMFATKVNFWVMNHHTGQKVAQGYFAKVMNSFEHDIAGPWVDACWMVGHWLNTRKALATLGITVQGGRVITTSDSDATPCVHVSEDMRLRLNSNPAGTAREFVLDHVCQVAKMSQYCVALPNIAGFPGFAAYRAKVIEKPARFHMGSLYLTGEPRIVEQVFSEEDEMNLSAFVHAAMPGSTLARSPSLKSLAEVSTSPVYTAIVSMKISLARMRSDDDMLKAAAELGAAVGGFVVQSGRLSKERLAEVVKVDE